MKAHRIVCALLLTAVVLSIGPFVPRADAYQCTELTLYADIWDNGGDDNQDQSVALWGRGVAESGEPCGVDVEAYIVDPSNAEITSTWGHGTGSASADVVVYLGENSAQGNYQARSEGWSQGVHYGCGFSPVVNISAFIANYQYVSGQTYSRCDVGSCLFMRIVFSTIPPPAFARLAVVRVGYSQDTFTCTGLSRFPIPSCTS